MKLSKRSLKVNYFLTKRALNRLDTTEKVGLAIVTTVIVPFLFMICINIDVNNLF